MTEKTTQQLVQGKVPCYNSAAYELRQEVARAAEDIAAHAASDGTRVPFVLGQFYRLANG